MPQRCLQTAVRPQSYLSLILHQPSLLLTGICAALHTHIELAPWVTQQMKEAPHLLLMLAWGMDSSRCAAHVHGCTRRRIQCADCPIHSCAGRDAVSEGR